MCAFQNILNDDFWPINHYITYFLKFSQGGEMMVRRTSTFYTHWENDEILAYLFLWCYHIVRVSVCDKYSWSIDWCDDRPLPLLTCEPTGKEIQLNILSTWSAILPQC